MMSERSISVSDLSFVRDVLIPRCSYVEGPEVNILVQLRLRIDAIFTDIEVELAAGRPEPARAAPANVATVNAVTPPPVPPLLVPMNNPAPVPVPVANTVQ
jgi:hypothetical protein